MLACARTGAAGERGVGQTMLRAPRTLSSPDTFFVKLVPMGVCLAFLCFSAYRVLAFRTELGLFGAMVAASLFFYGLCGRLKTVQVDDTTLYVAGLRHEIQVPLREVVSVYEIPLLQLRAVAIRLRYSTAFGRTILFRPPFLFMGILDAHPVVAELEKAVQSAAGVTRSPQTD